MTDEITREIGRLSRDLDGMKQRRAKMKADLAAATERNEAQAQAIGAATVDGKDTARDREKLLRGRLEAESLEEGIRQIEVKIREVDEELTYKRGALKVAQQREITDALEVKTLEIFATLSSVMDDLQAQRAGYQSAQDLGPLEALGDNAMILHNIHKTLYSAFFLSASDPMRLTVNNLQQSYARHLSAVRSRSS